LPCSISCGEDMKSVISNQQNRALIFLLSATAISYLISHDASIGIWAGIGTLAISFVKVRLVILDFMELRHAPIQWRIGFEGGFFVVSAILIAVYAFGGVR